MHLQLIPMLKFPEAGKIFSIKSSGLILYVRVLTDKIKYAFIFDVINDNANSG
jgi:hypothetical protein